MGQPHWVRSLVRRFGFDILRFPGAHPAQRRVSLLRHYLVGVVLDVGANDGVYARELRRFGYPGRVVSFEPLIGPYLRLHQQAARDPGWTAVNVALGAETAFRPMHVAANSVSSSFLPMREAHRAAAPDAAYVGGEAVLMTRLDDVFEQSCGSDVPFLKLDVQGYEEQVLLGGTHCLPALQGVQLEMSLVPLYEGAWSFAEALEFLTSSGFELVSLEPGFHDRATGRLLQVDGIFMRPGEKATP